MSPAQASTSSARVSPGVLVRLSEVAGEADDEFHQWYQQHQLSEPLAVDGFRGARRYQVAGGEPTYMTVYECNSIDVLASPAYQAVLANPSAASQKLMPHVRDTLQFACRETWSVGEGIGGSAIVVQCKPMHGREDAARAFIRDNFDPRTMPALVRMSLWEADGTLGAMFAPPALHQPHRGLPALASTRQRRDRGKSSTQDVAAAPLQRSHGAHWVLAMESYDVAKMALAVHAQLLGCESDKTGLLVGSWTRYQLICAHRSARAN